MNFFFRDYPSLFKKSSKRKTAQECKYCDLSQARNIYRVGIETQTEALLRIIIPKRFFDVSTAVTRTSPLFFLAGPVLGGGNWQVAMSRLLKQKFPECVIAVPHHKWDGTNPLHHYFSEDEDPKRFEYQLNWEQHYLHEAGLGKHPGCIIFWLPEESKAHPHPGPEPYAMDTRRELGKWEMLMKYKRARVVVGGQSFYGISQIQRDFSYELGRPFTIHSTMKETAEAAAKVALGGSDQ